MWLYSFGIKEKQVEYSVTYTLPLGKIRRFVLGSLSDFLSKSLACIAKEWSSLSLEISIKIPIFRQKNRGEGIGGGFFSPRYIHHTQCEVICQAI